VDEKGKSREKKDGKRLQHPTIKYPYQRVREKKRFFIIIILSNDYSAIAKITLFPGNFPQ